MAEQQQDVEGEQHPQSDILVEKKPLSTPTHTVKIHKTKRHRRRHNKHSSSQATPQTAAEMDIETDPAVHAISKKTNVVEPVVPTTPAIVEDVDDIPSKDVNNTPSLGQGDRKGLPYMFADAIHLRETFIRGQGRPQGDAPPIRRDMVGSGFVYGRGVPLRAPWFSLTRRTIFTYTLLALLLVSMILLWQDLTATHVYVNTLNASDGTIRTQQDIGGYRNNIHLTAPLDIPNTPTSTVLGVYTSGQGDTQQLLTFHQTASNMALQHSVSLANGAITQDTYGHLLVESVDGLHVVTQDGQVLWHMQGQQPTHSVHSFAPTSDRNAVYTIASVTHSQVAAYTLTNGHVRWTQTLPDTLEYAPPFLVNGDTLYVASDHNIFALNNSDGSIRWEKPYAARTLLLENGGQQHLLLVLSSQGIQALQSDTGAMVWAFRGDPAVSTLPTQFYQGTTSHVSDTGSNTLYATGVVWHMPTVREDVWLYAIDATTGRMRWSQLIASGSTGVDAGRVLQPLLDTENGMVIVQRAIQQNEHAVTAYDAQTGRQRWNTPLIHMNTSSPGVFQLSKNTFAVFTTTTNSTTILWTPSFYRSCLLLLLLVSMPGLLLLLFLSRATAKVRVQHIIHPITMLLSSIRYRWKYVYTVSAIAFLCICISVSSFAYIHSSQPGQTVLATDAQGSVVTTNTGDNLQQIEALHPDGTRQWTLFSSEGAFSVPDAHMQTGMLLVALHGDTAHTYVVAEDDPAYSRPLDTMLALYLLNRTTGHVVWQQVVSYPDEQQRTQVIGADKTYIYVAGEHTLPTQANTKSLSVSQLFAVNKLTGTVDWRIFGSTQPSSKQNNTSTLRIEKNGLALWHVDTIVFTIDTNVGQIIGRTTSGT